MKEKLYYYDGKYWLYDGESNGINGHRIHLVNPFDTSKGYNAEVEKVREIKGGEYRSQMEAINNMRGDIHDLIKDGEITRITVGYILQSIYLNYNIIIL